MSSHFQSKRGKAKPEISTASLPDIVFMLLFFFMVVTVMRDAEIMLKVQTPSATQLTKLEEKSLVNYIYIGKPMPKYESVYGTKPRIQLDDQVVDGPENIPLFLEKHKVKIPESRHPLVTTSLRIDGEVTMGIVQDVKTMLRKQNQLRLNYSAKPKPTI
ncbi:MAG: biopolymer transporter ExbD [Saprospiraceae bacterium]|jgi:biopolymer transport protein ExbD|nr:biopolymer transporter ExbD [Saprospiraceae bacterium]